MQITKNGLYLSPGDYGEFAEKIVVFKFKIDTMFEIVIGFFVFGSVFIISIILYLWFFTSNF